MVTEFRVDKGLKKDVEQKLYQNRGSAQLKRGKNLFLYLIILAPAVFLIYAYLISDGFVYLHDRYGTLGQKNSVLICTAAAAIAVVMLIFELVFSILAKGLANRETHGRFSESLLMDGSFLRYSYRNYMDAKRNDMVVVEIHLDGSVKVLYRPLTHELSFSGSICSIYYDDYGRGVTRGNQNCMIDRFSIYDYFSPSLYEYLKEQGYTQI